MDNVIPYSKVRNSYSLYRMCILPTSRPFCYCRCSISTFAVKLPLHQPAADLPNPSPSHPKPRPAPVTTIDPLEAHNRTSTSHSATTEPGSVTWVREVGGVGWGDGSPGSARWVVSVHEVGCMGLARSTAWVRDVGRAGTLVQSPGGMRKFGESLVGWWQGSVWLGGSGFVGASVGLNRSGSWVRGLGVI